MTKLSVGPGHSCVVRGAGVVSCWGDNDYGQNGVKSEQRDVAGRRSLCRFPRRTSPRAAPTRAPCSRTEAFAAGASTTTVRPPAARPPDPRCAPWSSAVSRPRASPSATITRALSSPTGTILCWGKGTVGSLGNGVRADATTPVVVKNITTGKDDQRALRSHLRGARRRERLPAGATITRASSAMAP